MVLAKPVGRISWGQISGERETEGLRAARRCRDGEGLSEICRILVNAEDGGTVKPAANTSFPGLAYIIYYPPALRLHIELDLDLQYARMPLELAAF